MNNELVSIVVPAYNVEKYIKKCVESIINQTYKNIEIILVDDGSTDKTGEICDYFNKKDDRIKVIHKENGGLSDARNCGIDVAKGKYILLIDSDDYVDLEIVEFLYNDLKNNNADISTCLPQKFKEGNCENLKDNSKNINNVLNTENALEDLFYLKNLTVSAWGKLYKSELFKDIKYPKGKLYEDLPTTYRLFAKSKIISTNTKKMYYYLIRKGSIMNSKFNEKRMDSLYFTKDQTKYIKNNFPNILNSAINQEFMEAVGIAKEIPLNKKYSKERKEIIKVFKKYRINIINDKKAPIKNKIYAIFSLFNIIGIKILVMFYKFLKKRNFN